MRNIVAIILLLVSSQVQAVWSTFAHVTPETEGKYDVNVEFSAIKDHRNIFQVKLNAVGYDHKHAWLIIASEKLSEKEQELRAYIWEAAPIEKEILVKAKLHPKGKGDELYYEIELSSELIRTAYVYIDFPSLVFDGGYYYSIDLDSFLSVFEKSANKAMQFAPAAPDRRTAGR